MNNPYQTLGVDRTATPEEIKRAYRKLAGRHHPDKGGDRAKFQEIQAAYDAITNPRPQHSAPGGFGGGAPFDFQSIFDIFGTKFNANPYHNAQQANHTRFQARMTLWIQLRDSAEGGTRTISVGTQQGTQAVEIQIPHGIDDGDTVQYGGIAPGGMDLIITFRIHPSPGWQRQGLNLVTEHSVMIWDLLLGGESTVKDILGNQLSIRLDPYTQPGTVMRLRGRGLRKGDAQGDLLVRLQARIPNNITPELQAAIQQNRT
jgi:curved DNA-binding protein